MVLVIRVVDIESTAQRDPRFNCLFVIFDVRVGLVGDLSNQLFEHVLEGHETSGAAVLINDNEEVALALLDLGK